MFEVLAKSDLADEQRTREWVEFLDHRTISDQRSTETLPGIRRLKSVLPK